MSSPKKGTLQKGAVEDLNRRRRSLESIFQGDKVDGLTETTKSEFSKRVEKLAGRSAGNLTEARQFRKELEGIEAELKQAQEGEGRFGERQALQERRELLEDRPGRRQIFNFR